MYNRTLNDWSRRKQRVSFPLDLNVEGFRESKLTISRGNSHRVLFVLLFLSLHLFVLLIII